jgi:hypothetical protein
LAGPFRHPSLSSSTRVLAHQPANRYQQHTVVRRDSAP